MTAEGSVPLGPHQVQSLDGTIGSDFWITGEIIWLGPAESTATGLLQWAPLRMHIEFDETNQISLREDRQPGVTGLHCPDPSGYCPDPLVLVPVE